MKLLHLVLIGAFGAVGASAQSARPFQNAETGRSYSSLQAAVDSIGNGEGTIIIAPGLFRQCAVQKAGVIAFRAAIPGQSILDGKICEGKAVMVLRGRAARVDGLVIQNARGPAGVGVGVWLERGNLNITRSVFRNSDMGISTADDPAGVISITQSSFNSLGICRASATCTPGISVGSFGTLSIASSRFERGNGGHYISSRAAQVTITNNAFDDSRGRATGYMIDLPAGANGSIASNIFVQGVSKKQDSAFIAVASEGRVRSSAGLSINANEASIVPGTAREAVFVADWSGDRLAIGGNRLGRGLKPFEKR